MSALDKKVEQSPKDEKASLRESGHASDPALAKGGVVQQVSANTEYLNATAAPLKAWSRDSIALFSFIVVCALNATSAYLGRLCNISNHLDLTSPPLFSPITS